jgi:hypothetical protein
MVYRIGKSMIEDAEAKGLIVPGKVDVISVSMLRDTILVMKLNCILLTVCCFRACLLSQQVEILESVSLL